MYERHVKWSFDYIKQGKKGNIFPRIHLTCSYKCKKDFSSWERGSGQIRCISGCLPKDVLMQYCVVCASAFFFVLFISFHKDFFDWTVFQWAEKGIDLQLSLYWQMKVRQNRRPYHLWFWICIAVLKASLLGFSKGESQHSSCSLLTGAFSRWALKKHPS